MKKHWPFEGGQKWSSECLNIMKHGCLKCLVSGMLATYCKDGDLDLTWLQRHQDDFYNELLTALLMPKLVLWHAINFFPPVSKKGYVSATAEEVSTSPLSRAPFRLIRVISNFKRKKPTQIYFRRTQLKSLKVMLVSGMWLDLGFTRCQSNFLSFQLSLLRSVGLMLC